MAGSGGETSYGAGVGETGGQTVFAGKGNGGRPTETVNLTQKIGTAEASLYASSTSTTAAKGVLLAPSNVRMSNKGGAPAGVLIKLNHWSDDTTNAANPIYLQFIVRAGETINFPMSRVIAADNVATFMDGTALAQAAPDSNMFRASGATVNNAEGGDHVINSASATNLWLAEGEWTSAAICSGNKFRVGDLIRIGNEILEVSAKGSMADGTNNNYLTVMRGVHGSTAATHTNGDDIRIAFFNAYHPFDAATGGYDKVQTDNDGKFRATNFFGYGRGTSYTTTGILPGSVSFKCYNPGYQELGLSGITAGTNTGLTASTTYYFFIAVDGGSAYEVGFTTDASNTNFGGRNGVLSKIQDIFNTQYYTTGATLFETKVNVALVNGDVRFTSGSRLSTSAIALTAGTSGADTTTEIFAQAIGRLPILAKIEDAIAARLPDNSLSTISSGQSVSNIGAFMYDDGYGNLVGKGRGTINYDTGEVNFVSYPNTEFVVSARYGNAMSGAVSEGQSNTIEEILARSLNDNIETTVSLSVTGYNLNA